LEVAQLVTEPRGELELELPRRLEHLRVEVGDERLEFGRTLRGEALASQVRRGSATASTVGSRTTGEKFRRVGLFPGEHFGDVGDALAQRLRIDAVLEVVGDLLLAAAVRLVDRVRHRVR